MAGTKIEYIFPQNKHGEKDCIIVKKSVEVYETGEQSILSYDKYSWDGKRFLLKKERKIITRRIKTYIADIGRNILAFSCISPSPTRYARE